MRFEKQLFLSLAKNLESARGEESNKQRRANKLIDNQRRLYLQFKFLCASSSFYAYFNPCNFFFDCQSVQLRKVESNIQGSIFLAFCEHISGVKVRGYSLNVTIFIITFFYFFASGSTRRPHTPETTRIKESRKTLHPTNNCNTFYTAKPTHT